MQNIEGDSYTLALNSFNIYMNIIVHEDTTIKIYRTRVYLATFESKYIMCIKDKITGIIYEGDRFARYDTVALCGFRFTGLSSHVTEHLDRLMLLEL